MSVSTDNTKFYRQAKTRLCGSPGYIEEYYPSKCISEVGMHKSRLLPCSPLYALGVILRRLESWLELSPRSGRLSITAAGLISGRPGRGWRVFCQSWQMGAKSLVMVKADYV